MKTRSRLLHALVGAGILLSCGGCRILFRRSDRPLPPPPERGLRLPPRGAPLTGFEQTAGWEVSSETGRVRLDKDRSKAIWGEFAGWVRFTPRNVGPHKVNIRPREPWRVNAPFNIMTLWLWHEVNEAPVSEGFEVVLHGIGPKGGKHSWSFPYMPREGWQMLHLRVAEDEAWPLELTQLRWQLPKDVDEPQELFLENLSVYQESVTRIPREIQFIRPHDYAPAFAPRRQGSVLLDFPPRPAAFRPVGPLQRHVVSLEREDEDLYRFRYGSEDTVLEYHLRMRENFPEISVRVNGVNLGRIWRGVEFNTLGEPPEFRLSRMEDGKLILQYAQGLRFTVSLQGRTLELEAHSLNETFTGLKLGHFIGGGDVEVERLDFPFLRLAQDFPWPLAQIRHQEQFMYASVLPDWWFSMAGNVKPPLPLPLPLPLPEASNIGLGHLEYAERWKGSRNVFRERIYFTVSPHVEDVLPGPSAPPGLLRREAGRIFWPSEEALTLRLVHMHPTDPEWREDDLARDPGGNWRGYASQRYFMKSSRFYDLGLSRLGDAWGGGPYAYAHAPWLSRFPPWRFTDFDARVLGAGTFAQTWAELGVLLQQSAAETGLPLLGDGGSEWLYSGFLSGLVPVFKGGFSDLHPFLPQIAHQNISPYSALMGMGRTESFRLESEGNVPEEVLFWRQVATQIAYTAAGRIPEVESTALKELAKKILEPLHARFTESRVVRLLYWNGTNLQPVTASLADGSLRESQIYFRLESGDEIWVNGSLESTWSILVEGREYVLPSFGFLFRGTDFRMKRVQTADGKRFSSFQGPDESWRVEEAR